LCWALAFRHRYAEASALFERINRNLDPRAVDPATLDDLRALEPLLVSMTDRVGDCLHVAQVNLEKCSDRESFARGVLQLICACHLLEVGDYSGAQRFLRACQRDNTRTGSALSAVYGECFSGALHLMQGRLAEALGHYRSAYAQVKGVLPGYSVIGAVAAIFLAEALYERDELDEAGRLLQECRDLFSECMPPDVMMIGYVTLARIRMARGDLSGAAALHAEAERIGGQRGLPRVAATIHLEQVRMSLRRGDLTAAEAAADRPEDRAVWKELEGWARLANDVETPEVSALRLMTRRGEAAKTLPRLRSELDRAEVSLRSRRALKIRVLLAEALSATGDKRGALRALREALQHGSREGFVRAFADEGGAVLSLVRDLRGACDGEEGGGDGYAAYLDRILAADGDVASPSPAVEAKGVAWPFEALTSREVEIIRMASAGYSNHALAERLFVSVPTVKYHLRNINVKLHSANRTEAIAKARRFGLIG
jgi:LuxR family maltose regulon positive regulatory protein